MAPRPARGPGVFALMAPRPVEDRRQSCSKGLTLGSSSDAISADAVRVKHALDGVLVKPADSERPARGRGGGRSPPQPLGLWRDRRGSPAEGGRRNPAQPLGLRPACRGRKVDAAQERARWRVVGRRNPAQPLGLRPACRGRKVDAAQERARWRVVVVLRQGAGVGVVSLLAPGQPPHLVRGQRLRDDGPDSLRCSLSHCRAAARRARRSLGRKVEQATGTARSRVARVQWHSLRGSKALLARGACGDVRCGHGCSLLCGFGRW